MSSFTFHNPTLVRRFGTIMVIGISLVLIALTLLLTNIARGKYAAINDREFAIAQAEAAAAAGVGSQAGLSYYQNETPQLAQAQMQSDMQALAEEFQVILEVIRADQVEPVEGALRLVITLNGVVDEAQLGGYLQALSQHEPMVVVDSISLRRARSERGVDDRPLAIQLMLSGFAQQ